MDEPDNFQKRYETENFIIKIERPHFGDKDTDVRAKIYCKYKESDRNDPYYAEHKLSGRQITQFAKRVCKAYKLDVDDYYEEVESELLARKSEIAETAEERTQWIRDNFDVDGDNDEREEKQNMVNSVIKKIYKHDNPTIEDFADIRNFNELQEANQDLILRQGDNLLLTNKGKSEAEEILGITQIEDIDAEAEEVLEDNPIQYILAAMDEVHKGDQELKIWELISALSAKCSSRQINSWAVGPSGKGKSHIKRAIVEFLPEEAYEAPNSMSPKAMLYKTQKEGSDYFKGKLLFLDEAEGHSSDDAVVLLRGLTDPDEDTFIHEMVQDQSHEELIIEKPVTVWFTSVESMNDEQLKNRFILTNPDGSSELDDKVFEHQQWNLHTGQELGKPPAEAEVVRTMLSKIRSNTAGLTPIVPFKVEWKQKFNRRLYPYFVTLMEIIAKMNYKNRVIKENYIYVTRADFHLAALIWASLIDTTIAQTDTEALKLILQLPEREGEAATTSELASRLESFNTDKVRRKADQLRETEELSLINARKDGNRWEYWAGKDKERLVSPEPEIKADPETMEEILEHTEKKAGPGVIDSVTGSDIPVYDQLKERQDKIKDEKMEEANNWNVDVTQDERKMLKTLEDFSFDQVDLQFVVSTYGADKDEAWEILDSLEEKGLIKYREDDGTQKAVRTQTYKQVREEGKLTL